MSLPRRDFLHLAAGAAVLPAISRVAWAQAYPARPARIVVPFAAGVGDTTLSAAQQYTRNTNQPICYTAYRRQYQDVLASRNLKWTDDMDGRLRGVVTAQDFYWIDLGC